MEHVKSDASDLDMVPVVDGAILADRRRTMGDDLAPVRSRTSPFPAM
jgi:hypothetical protein